LEFYSVVSDSVGSGWRSWRRKVFILHYELLENLRKVLGAVEALIASHAAGVWSEMHDLAEKTLEIFQL